MADTQNHLSIFICIDDIGCYNPWDYYFKPCSPQSLEEAYCSSGTIISNWKPREENRDYSYTIFHELSDIMLNKINVELEKFIGEKKYWGS